MRRRPHKEWQDIPLEADRFGWSLSSIIGVMVLLATLALAAQMGLQHIAHKWENNLSGRWTVELRLLPESSPSLEARTDAALKLLRDSDVVIAASALSPTQMRSLLGPWLQSLRMLDTLPLPVLIDVQIRTDAQALTELATRLQQAVPGLSIDTHNAALHEARQLLALLRLVAFSILILVSAAALLAVVLVVRAGLLAHANIIAILNIMGATDIYIAKQFQLYAWRLARLGAAMGFTLALLVLLALWALLPPLAITQSGIDWLQSALWLLLLLAVPLLVAGGAALVGRFACLHLLERSA